MAKRRKQEEQKCDEPGHLWHSRPAEFALLALQGDRNKGLSPEEAQCRLEKFGRNRLPQAKTPSPWLRFFHQFNNVLIYVLLASAVGAMFTGDPVDAAIIFCVVLINAIIGFFQGGKRTERHSQHAFPFLVRVARWQTDFHTRRGAFTWRHRFFAIGR